MSKIVLEGPDGKIIASFTNEESAQIRAKAKTAGMTPEAYLKAILKFDFYKVNN